MKTIIIFLFIILFIGCESQTQIHSKSVEWRVEFQDLNAIVDKAKVDELNWQSKKISSLPIDIFSGMTSLKIIHLNDNQLSSLPERLFKGLPLQEVYLHDNQLKSLPVGLFKGLSDLNYISLLHNQLKSLPKGIFKNLPGLKKIDLKNNQFSSLEKERLKKEYPNITIIL